LELPAEDIPSPFQLASMDLTVLARAIFAPLPPAPPPYQPAAPGAAPPPPLPLQLAKHLDWGLVARNPKLATRGLLVLVAVSRSVAAAAKGDVGITGGGGSGAGWEAGAMPALLGCVGVAAEAAGGAPGGLDEGDWYLLCMLEVSHRQSS
jgi:hypothetical protein